MSKLGLTRGHQVFGTIKILFGYSLKNIIPLYFCKKVIKIHRVTLINTSAFVLILLRIKIICKIRINIAFKTLAISFNK